MELQETIVNLLTQYELAAIFVGAFFFGEAVILTAAFLAGQGLWSLLNVAWIAFVATMISDTLWFMFGRQILAWRGDKELDSISLKKLIDKLENLTGDKPFVSLLFIKFLYGSRVVMIIYLSLRRVSLRNFLVYNAAGTLIWLTVLLPIGWLAGRSIINLIPYVDSFEITAAFLILVVIIVRITTKWLSQKIANK